MVSIAGHVLAMLGIRRVRFGHFQILEYWKAKPSLRRKVRKKPPPITAPEWDQNGSGMSYLHVFHRNTESQKKEGIRKE